MLRDTDRYGEASIKIDDVAASTMSEEQLKAFLEAVKADVGLEEKLKGAADLDAAVEIAAKAGFDVSNSDWLEAQKPSDKELEGISGGGITMVNCNLNDDPYTPEGI